MPGGHDRHWAIPDDVNVAKGDGETLLLACGT
jgi:hypothetical protein